MMMRDATAFEPLIVPYPRDPDDIIPDAYDEDEEGDDDE